MYRLYLFIYILRSLYILFRSAFISSVLWRGRRRPLPNNETIRRWVCCCCCFSASNVLFWWSNIWSLRTDYFSLKRDQNKVLQDNNSFVVLRILILIIYNNYYYYEKAVRPVVIMRIKLFLFVWSFYIAYYLNL